MGLVDISTSFRGLSFSEEILRSTLFLVSGGYNRAELPMKIILELLMKIANILEKGRAQNTGEITHRNYFNCV